ncbi:MAG: hypothetical protein IAG10_19180 [Planctomycetaceae bacterium]|nr:hypothetical protein [Planctomycetaceae bacterium]
MRHSRENHREWTWCGVAAGLCLILTVCSVPHTEETKSKAASAAGTKSVAKEAVAPFQDLVGGWRGTALPKRGSSSGGWTEKAEWRWKFDGENVALEYAVDEGKLLQSAWMSFDPKTKSFRLKTVELGVKKGEIIEREYTGTSEGNKLIFDTPAKDGAEGRRITVTRLNEKRTLVLFEQKGAGQNFFNRIAEVGYTREGTRLAESDQTGPVCVVTGGQGTIKVAYKGETYWVCCTGCRDAFNDDPEGVLADYQKMLDQRKAGKK